jgi:uncharacterized membrane protein YhaH (DUF805 family)
MWWAKGRINRTSYWAFVVALVAIAAALRWASGKQTGISEVFLLAITVPRLHDIGRSGWWAGGVILAEIGLAVIVAATLPKEMALGALGLFVLFIAILMIVLGCLPGDPEANQFGEPPPRGLSLRRSQPSDAVSHF